VLICGVSTRAAAESAARAGYAVEAIDAFGDLDQHPSVRARSMTRDLGRPFTATAAARAACDVECDAVAYLSPFENHPRAVDALARGRALWGNPPDVLRRVRDPRLLSTALRARDLPSPAVRAAAYDVAISPNASGWLIKPLRSGGGHGIRSWRGGAPLPRGAYLQERVSGTPGSFVFIATRGRVTPLAISRQLIGDAAFGATGYRYCGNIVSSAADLGFDGTLAQTALQAAAAVVEAFGLVGLNGIDFMARDDVPFTLEVNPRWTGAMELVERWAGISLFAAHAAAFGARDASPLAPSDVEGLAGRPGAGWPMIAGSVGKAVVFARTDVVMGDTRGWLDDESVRDVPHPGERIAAGHPVCTVFANGRNAAECHAALVRRTRLVYEELAGLNGQNPCA
jgi:hypothetical protein